MTVIIWQSGHIVIIISFNLNTWKMDGCQTLQILAGAGIAMSLNEILAAFKKSGRCNSLEARYGTTPELLAIISSKVHFDVVIVPEDVFMGLTARNYFIGDHFPCVARAVLGLAVRKGTPTPKPDITSPDALKNSLLSARGIASIPASATGARIKDVYDQLGILDAMIPKTIALPAPELIAKAVHDGDADIAVFLTHVLMDPRLDFVGPFPCDAQREVVYLAAIGEQCKNESLASDFITFVQSQESKDIIAARGMVPG
jgi:molybdate transport system substrate-binding protein